MGDLPAGVYLFSTPHQLPHRQSTSLPGMDLVPAQKATVFYTFCLRVKFISPPLESRLNCVTYFGQWNIRKCDPGVCVHDTSHTAIAKQNSALCCKQDILLRQCNSVKIKMKG